MIDLSQVQHHPVVDEIVEVICNRTQNTDRGFFDIEVAYFLCKMAASMRVVLQTKHRGEIPVNCYAIALGSSGSGKNFSISIFENDFLRGFRNRFMTETFLGRAQDNLWAMAVDRSIRNGTEEKTEMEGLEREFRSLGPLLFTFDSATAPAVKQMRQKLLLAGCGAINMQIDEIGSNLVGQTEVINTFLELYDQGQIKQKLTKNTAENQRGEELEGKTPTNMLWFGTPSKLLDGGSTEDAFYEFLETGYARRCLFGIGGRTRASRTLSAKEIYNRMVDPVNGAIIQKWADHFYNLADPARYGWRINVDDDVAIALLDYEIDCQNRADELPEHEEILKAEITHRYFKALKLAGAFAYIDESLELELIHLQQAIKLVEQSGDCFKSILQREKTYVKLARFLGGSPTVEHTHADLLQSLPFYPAAGSRRSEMMALAQAWGYKNSTIIKKTFVDGIEFFRGETLEATDLEAVTFAYSQDMAYHYAAERQPFAKLHLLAQAPDHHWTNHHFQHGHRSRANVLPGFDLLVLDVDGSIQMDVVHDLLKEHTFFTYTTKRHSEEVNRFRVVMPMNYRLKMVPEEYREFMTNVIGWLPFAVDPSVTEPEKKWLTNAACQYHYNWAEPLDILPFIPKTSKNEQYIQNFEKVASMDNLERWFAERMSQGNRNNHMLRYAMALLDNGCDYPEIEARVLGLNSKTQAPLLEDEIRHTVLVTVAKKLTP